MMKVSKLALFACAAALAACGDTVAPTAQSTAAPNVTGEGVTTELTQTDTARFQISINPRRTTTYNLGAGNYLTFPENSVCDPKTSSYGVTEWDKPCTAARSSVTVTVLAWLDAGGHPRVDFTPHLRFVPSNVASNWVVLTFADMSASLDPWYNILYCPSVTAACYDESTTDPSLLTTRNPVTGKVTRRIKHFSGYLVGAGDDSSSDGRDANRLTGGVKLPSAGVNSVDGTSEHRSGYILVSGRQ